MALALRSLSRSFTSNPTRCLDNAIQDFETALTKDERKRYRSNCIPPNAQTVLDFVSEIDLNSRGRGGRCVATRLVTFLDTVQRFLMVIDTFVSSNPGIAALIWGGIKTTILIASNFVSFFDKVTSLIMDIGRSCPTYREFGDLFPDNIRLQSTLCEYYAVVVRLCLRIIQESHASRTSILFRAFVPLDTTFKPYQDDIKRVVKEVELQILLASEHAAKIERKENTRLRDSLSAFQTNSHNRQMHAKVRQAMKIRRDIRDTLSSINHVKPWKRLRQQCVSDTTTWIERDFSFLAWFQDRNSCSLWFHGTLGTGKTIAVSTVIAYLHTSQMPLDNIAYFFCQSEEPITLHARDIIGCIVAQLLDSYIEIATNDELDRLYQLSKDFDVDDISGFVSYIRPGGTNFVIIDGLNECDERDISKVSKVISKLVRDETKLFKIFCAGRPELASRLLQNIPSDYKMTTAGEMIDLDIQRYIEVTLHEKLGTNQLALCDPSLILRIRDVLTQGAHGMFLWTRLLIEDICSQETDSDIIAILDHPPSKLIDLYRRMKQRVSSSQGAIRAIKTLQICGVSKRPLTIKEFREALTIDRNQDDTATRRMSIDFQRVIADCSSFLFVEEEERTVHYIHHSARTYLFTKDPESREYTFNQTSLNKELGISCLVYLNSKIFRRQIVKVSKSSQALMDPSTIAQGAVYQNCDMNKNLSAKIAQRLLLGHSHWERSKFGNPQQLKRILQETLGDTESARLESTSQTLCFHFRTYAETFWISHLQYLDDSDSESWDMFFRFVETLNRANQPWNNYRPGKTTLHLPTDTSEKIKWIMEHDHAALLLHEHYTFGGGLSGEIRIPFLIHSAGHGRIQLVKVLLKVPHECKKGLGQAIRAAAAAGYPDIVDSLIMSQYHVNPATTAAYHEVAIDAAAKARQVGILKKYFRLSSHNYILSQDILCMAARRGQCEFVEWFLSEKPECVSSTDSLGQNVLHVAVEEGQLEVVVTILEAKADVNAEDSSGQKALHLAASNGYLAVVETLLSAKTDVHHKDKNGQTALYYAAKSGNLEIVERLLAAEVAVFQKDLKIAIEMGHTKVINRLLLAPRESDALDEGEKLMLE